MDSLTKTRRITGTAVLAALSILFQAIGNLITFPGGIAINLALVPIALGAILYGPITGLFLGLANGVTILFAPSTAGFLSFNPVFTVITVLSKGILCGLIPGLIFKLFNGKATIPGMFVTAFLVPIINTSVFTIFALTIFEGFLNAGGMAQGEFMKYYFLTIIGINFILEIVTTALLSPSIVYFVKHVTKNIPIGDQLDKKMVK